MQKSKFVQIQDDLPGTHFFTYKGKEYPINIDFFKCYSKYFSNNQIELQTKKYISLLGEDSSVNIDLSEESIQNFINFVHRQQIPLTDDNVIHLNYLAKKYEVPLLINVTNDYISSNHADLVLQLLILYQRDTKFHPEQYEDIISKGLPNYLDDDRLLSLDISMLFRIVDRYLIEKEKLNENEEDDKLMQFLFKCLKKFGIKASALFTHVNFTNEKAKYLNQLLFDPNIEFDFHFVGCSFLKSFYKTQSEMIKKDEQSKSKNDELAKSVKDEFAKIRQEQETQLNEQKRLFTEELNKLRSEMNQSKAEQLNEQKRLFDEELNKLRSENEKLASQVKELLENKQKTDQEIANMEKNQEKQMSDLKKYYGEESNKMKKELIRFISDDKIFKQLSLLSNGKNVIESQLVGYETSSVDKGQIKNLFDNSLETIFRLADVDGGFILFDFKSKKVRLSRYYFAQPAKKTGWCTGRPKSWRIEGSNDKNGWDLLDLRENNSSLNGYDLSETFLCNKKADGWYRYIRIKEIISHDNNHKFLLSLIEFYGSISNG